MTWNYPIPSYNRNSDDERRKIMTFDNKRVDKNKEK